MTIVTNNKENGARASSLSYYRRISQMTKSEAGRLLKKDPCNYAKMEHGLRTVRLTDVEIMRKYFLKWRIGELERLEVEATRIAKTIEYLKSLLP